MQVTTIKSPADMPEKDAGKYTDEQLTGDLNYYRAEKLTQKMLSKGLINQEQYGRIMEENRRAFRPFLAEIL